jgi:flagellar biosynthesis/type III secretory pathway M-ring protein FliF/YscJ
MFASVGHVVKRSPYQVAACAFTLFSLVVYAVIRRRRRSAVPDPQESEHSPLTTKEESDGIAATGAEEADGSASESDERESVSERKALTGLV